MLVPRWALHLWLDVLDAARVIPPRPREERANEDSSGNSKPYVRLSLGLNLVTGPLLASLFLLAIGAVGRDEVHDALIGDDNISPVDIMVFFITLAYIALSIDASGLIRYLAFRVLQWGAKAGHRLFFCLYVFFFLLGSFIGNDPIILSGTAFLAYMTRASSNIVHPRAWIHTQFAVANMASAVLVSSNPTNLVLAGAFKVSFINYTANMIVPVVATAVILYPFLLYTVFADESLIPLSINMHELPDEVKARKPVNPNIPHARGHVQHDSLLSLEETMNPFLDKCGAAVGTVVMAATLVSVLALNAASTARGPYPVFWVTLPAASVMFCWDLGFGWYHRKETRRIARHGRREVELARARRAPQRLVQELETIVPGETEPVDAQSKHIEGQEPGVSDNMDAAASPRMPVSSDNTGDERGLFKGQRDLLTRRYPSSSLAGGPSSLQQRHNEIHPQGFLGPSPLPRDSIGGLERCSPGDIQPTRHSGPATLVSLVEDAFLWSQETFPTATTVVAHLPFALVPFAFCMFVLVQGLVTKGWVPVFAHGWGHWVDKTGTVGSIAGMGFLSVVLCNVRSHTAASIHRSTASDDAASSSPERISAPPFSSPASSRPGRPSTAPREHPFPTAPSGPRFIAWPWASTMAPLAPPSAHPSLACSGATFWLASTFACAASNSPA